MASPMPKSTACQCSPLRQAQEKEHLKDFVLGRRPKKGVCALVQAEAGAVESDKAAEAQAKAEAQAVALQSAEEARQRADRERAEARAKEWDPEELRMLEKAMARFPQGTAKRWEQVWEHLLGSSHVLSGKGSVILLHTASPT